MRTILALLLALCWIGTATAAPGTPANIFSNSSGSSVTFLHNPQSGDIAPGQTIIAFLAMPNTSAWLGFDSSGNTYTTASTNCTFNTNNHLVMIYAPVVFDLPAPVTATGVIGPASTTVTFTTNPGTLSVRQAITGAGVTADTIITGGISQWNGTTASATVSNSQSVASETLTISSSVDFSWTTAGKPAMAGYTVSGLAANTPLDVQATCQAGTSTTATPISPAVSTGALAQASELVFGAIGITNTLSSYASNSPFTNVVAGGISSATTSSLQMGYDIVSATTTVSYAPSWTTSRLYGAGVWTFKAASASSGGGNLTTLGVGN